MDKGKATGIGALIAAGIGSICCIGPVILAWLGLGAGTVAFARSFGILHMPMTILAFSLLAGAFYFHYRKKGEPHARVGCCQSISQKPLSHIFLWTATVLTGFLILLPYLV